MVKAGNIGGHRARYDAMARNRSGDELGRVYVGGGDPVLIGYMERELIFRHTAIDGASVIDIGCGIGRLAAYLTEEPISSYLGTDILPEMIEASHNAVGQDSRFNFQLISSCNIPEASASATVVSAFSVITHLMDEEVYEYFIEARRVLKPGGIFVISFHDLEHKIGQSYFRRFVKDHATRHDVLKFTTKAVLTFFGDEVGLKAKEFLDAGTDVNSTSNRKLTDGRESPARFSFGQSVVWLEAQ